MRKETTRRREVPDGRSGPGDLAMLSLLFHLKQLTDLAGSAYDLLSRDRKIIPLTSAVEVQTDTKPASRKA